MSLDDAVDYWNVVGKPMSYENLQVGQPLLLEDHRIVMDGEPLSHIVIVTDIDVAPNGERRLTFREAEPGEADGQPMVVMVAG